MDATPKKTRRTGTSPTARALADLRELGFAAQVVERFCIYSKRRIDLFGFIDIVAMHAGVGLLGIQATSDSNHAARVTKIKASPLFPVWLAAGGRVEVWSYGLRGDRGSRKTWTLRREEVKPGDQ